MQSIHIFKPGRHTSAQGSTLEFSEDALRASAAAYDPAVHEAPIVVGHPKDNAPAYGWVGKLAFAEGGLHAEPIQLEESFAELVKAGRFKKVSASFYTPDSPANPVPGIYYLRHVGFLGAQPPAIKGLKAANFAEGEQGVVEFSDGYTLATFMRRMREWVIEKFGAEDADKFIPSYVVESAEDAARAEMDQAAAAVSPSPAFSEHQESAMTPEEITALQAKAAKLEADLTALQAREASFAEREQALQLAEADKRRAASEAAVDGLIAEGKVLPAAKPGLAAFLEALPRETVVEFGEGDAAQKQGAQEYVLGFLKGLPKAVEFGERAPAGADAAIGAGTPEQIAARAAEFRETEHKAGREITITAAVDAVVSGKAA